jgi:hypothetical protein
MKFTHCFPLSACQDLWSVMYTQQALHKAHQQIIYSVFPNREIPCFESHSRASPMLFPIPLSAHPMYPCGAAPYTHHAPPAPIFHLQHNVTRLLHPQRHPNQRRRLPTVQLFSVARLRLLRHEPPRRRPHAGCQRRVRVQWTVPEL